MSHPMWVRGLKLSCSSYDRVKQKVAPYVGAWIETTILKMLMMARKSHPMWVRGLKLCADTHLVNISSRTLCGCVD